MRIKIIKPTIITLHYKTRDKLERLKKEAEQDGEYRVAKRIHAVLLNSSGITAGKIANTLILSRSSVSKWLSEYKQYGLESLLESHRSGRPPLLSPQNKVTLSDIIDSGPVAYGYTGSVWMAKMVSNVIWQQFGVKYSEQHVRRILRDLGFSVQSPTRSLMMANPAAKEKWRQYTYPRLKKKLKKIME